MRRLTVALALLLVACSTSGDDADDATPTTGSAATTAAADATTTTAAATTTTEPEAPGYEATVEALAADAMAGRDNGTPGSAAAQAYLVEQLSAIAEPLADDYRVPFEQGTNVIGVIRGAELPDEYVILGAHYDHLGSDCPSNDPVDDICNGAADNASGVAAVLEIGRRLAAGDPVRRSVVLAFWDAEEDGLLGSADYVADPLVPLAQTVTYLNWDMQGVDLLPSLQRLTVMVGAETGGDALVGAAAAAMQSPDLDPVQLSLLFGQGRSDHATFAAAGVPTVFFTDSTSACYHTAQDEPENLDFDKLGAEIDNEEALARDLASTTTPPSFVAGLPLATYDDARSMLALVETAQPDLSRFSADQQAEAEQYRSDLQAIVDAGAAAFDDEAIGTVLTGAGLVVQLLTEGECESFAI
jgi:hypothetical protein